MTQPRIPEVQRAAHAVLALALFAAVGHAQEPSVPDPTAGANPAPVEPQGTPVAQDPVPAPNPALGGGGPPVESPPAKPAQEPANPPPETKPAETPPVVAPVAKAPDAAPTSPAKLTAVLPSLGNVRDLASVQAALDKIVAEHASLAHSIPFGSTTDGRKLPALLFGAEGPIALEERPCVLLLGALDGESPTGGLAVLQMTAELLSEPATLPAGVSFAAVPWASPEGLELTLQGRSADGRNTRPVDEDRDGRIDEDGPDDLDGDGQILQMLVEDPEGPWIRPENQRLLAAARPGDAPRYSLALEGKDDDGDGRFNEDGPGGVVLDLNFPVGRTGPWVDDLGGVLPLSETLSRNYADFALGRRVAIVLLLQGNHGRLAIPGGTKNALHTPWMPEADRGVFERVNTAFLGSTARRSLPTATLLECRGKERRGAALDWFYCVGGALSVEIAPWGPALDAAPESTPKEKPGGEPRVGVSPEDLAWARWLDDTRGGLGFVDWHPVEIGGGTQALVGGWEPGARTSPPPESLARALQGLAEFARRVSAGLPRLELRIAEASRDGEVCRIRARVANAGVLPTGLSISDKRVGSVGAWLELKLPPGAKLIAGSERCSLARLAGGGISRECEWVAVAAAGSAFSLSAGGDWATATQKEVKP